MPLRVCLLASGERPGFLGGTEGFESAVLITDQALISTETRGGVFVVPPRIVDANAAIANTPVTSSWLFLGCSR